MRKTDNYTDMMFTKTDSFKPCPYPVYYGRDRRILLCAWYENGETNYTVAIVHSCLDWRSVRVFNISHTEYLAIQAKYYLKKHGIFADMGELFDPSITWRRTGMIGLYQTDYVL